MSKIFHMELMIEVLFEIGNGTLITARYQDIINNDKKSREPASRGMEKEVGVSCTLPKAKKLK